MTGDPFFRNECLGQAVATHPLKHQLFDGGLKGYLKMEETKRFSYRSPMLQIEFFKSFCYFSAAIR